MHEEIHPSIHQFKATRKAEKDAIESPKREREAAILKELDALLRAHAGHDVIDAARVALHHADNKHLMVSVPKHIPVLVRFEEKGGEAVLKFDVRRGRGIKTFDHLADALLFGEPYAFPAGEEMKMSFDTRKSPPKTTDEDASESN